MSSVASGIFRTDGPGASDAAARQGYEQAWQEFAQQQSVEDFCGSWLVIQCHAIGGVSDGVVVLRKSGTNSFAPVAFYPTPPRDRTHLAAVSELALKQGHGVIEPCEPPQDGAASEPRYQLAYPVLMEGEIRAVVGVEITGRPDEQLQEAMRTLQWGSSWLEVLLWRRADPAQAERQRLKLALELVSTLLEQPSLKESGTAFTTELAARLGCDRVSLGLLKGKRVAVTAVSHSPQFEKRANLLRAIERAMEEAIDQQDTVVFPATGQARPVVARAHEELLHESEAGSAATFPLIHGERVVGALTFERSAGHLFEAPTLEICEAVASVSGPIIDLKHASEASLPVHSWRSVKRLWSKIAGPGHPGWKLGTIGVIALVAFLALATGEFRISANSRIEGEVQRAVSAPIDGFVLEAPLRAGATVAKGQVIARLDDRDLQLERVKIESQRDKYLKQYREAMGKRERAQISIVSAQIEQAEAQLELVAGDLARMELVAPFDGVIVSGDLSQSLGSPVARGDVLFEVAPLDGYRVVLEVDERDIAYVRSGQRGELTMTSMPDQSNSIVVREITPVNIAREGRNFYRVEATLEDPGKAQLRPGMQGVGKIMVDERKLAWIWTRSFVDWMRLWMWSWLP